MYDSTGVTYKGSINRTKRGESCMSWEAAGNNNNLVFDPDDDPKDFCRNPKYTSGGRNGRPWCYVLERKKRKQRDCRNVYECSEYDLLSLKY